jgi:hypothetical protein
MNQRRKRMKKDNDQNEAKPLTAVEMQRRVKHPCQRLKDYKNRCRSGKKTSAYTIMADRAAYTMINVRVYLCPKCAEEMGV